MFLLQEEFSSIIGGGCECESDSDPEAEDATRNDDEEDNAPVQDVSGGLTHSEFSLFVSCLIFASNCIVLFLLQSTLMYVLRKSRRRQLNF